VYTVYIKYPDKFMVLHWWGYLTLILTASMPKPNSPLQAEKSHYFDQ
jgi:hypothetical protein